MKFARAAARLFRSHENRVWICCLGAAAPAVVFTVSVLVTGGYQLKVQWTVGAFVVLCWWMMAWAARERVISPLRTLANLLEAMREGDYSIRGRSTDKNSALGEVFQQANAMAATLRDQRLGAVEATALLLKVMEEIDVAVFTFDNALRLKLVNRAGSRLLARDAQRLLGLGAAELGLGGLLGGDVRRTEARSFPGATGRWEVRRSSFRENGLPHTLLVVSDLTKALREEELQAWQRLVRVLGHELNNSLTPIKSLAGSLRRMASRPETGGLNQEDMLAGLSIIESRSDSLGRFIGAYSRLAKLPRPSMSAMHVETAVRRAVAMEHRMKVGVIPGPDVTVRADADQIEQILINLIHNAVEAAQAAGGEVEAAWTTAQGRLRLAVRDTGHGLSGTNNLFVPFFTTKPGGSGIGLVLSRQIAEAHGGTLELSNRDGVTGCEALLWLPL
ncbi:MAG: PAS domain-containing sensor histidine kinase [Candidatus Solibacter sp.]|nr:PAS domain-containing sensor histidine kinase [Candidatus Solibacter sp.]